MKDFSLISVKADPGLKLAAQRKADELGITLSQVVNQALRDFVEQENYTFRPSRPETVSLVEEALVEYRSARNSGLDPESSRNNN
jgi:antitoxin component of RelBE/YafQ-DinJ toxin-antitoxin module